MRLLRSIGCFAAAAMLCAISLAPASAEVIQIDPGIHSVSVSKEYPAPVGDISDHVAIVTEVADVAPVRVPLDRSSVAVESASLASIAFTPSAYHHIDPDIANG